MQREFYFVVSCKHPGGFSQDRALGRVKSGSDNILGGPGALILEWPTGCPGVCRESVLT